MSDQPNDPTPTPADVAPKPQEPAAAAPDTPKDAPPWGDDFDAEKAWNLVQNLRSDKEKLQQRPTLTDEQKTKLAEYDRLAEASQSELEKAQAAAQKNAEQAQTYLKTAVTSKIEALATGFADPSDAVASLDAAKFVNESGAIDSEAIKAELAGLLERKPHWAKAPETRTPAPNPAQGSSGSGAAGLVQRSAEWVKQQSAAGNHEAIANARAAGELDDYLKS